MPQPLSRRRALSIIAFGGAAAALVIGGPRWARRAPRRERRLLMGTFVTVSVWDDDPDAADAAIAATFACMTDLETQLSRHRDDSEVGRLNANGRIDDAGDALLDVLALARTISDRGDGAFDVTVAPLVDLYQRTFREHGRLPDPSAIDAALALVGHRDLIVEGRTVRFGRPGMGLTLDGIGKGYIVDRAVDTLRGRGYADVLAEAGGDLMACGARTVGVQPPRPGMRLFRFETTDSAVATSGDYMQAFTEDCSHHHIIDPRRGRSAPELASSTVVAPNAALADGLATLTMVLGSAASVATLEAMDGCEGYFIGKDRSITRTSGFE